MALALINETLLTLVRFHDVHFLQSLISYHLHCAMFHAFQIFKVLLPLVQFHELYYALSLYAHFLYVWSLYVILVLYCALKQTSQI